MPLDQAKAQGAIDFFEGLLTHTKGSYARKQFLLPWWQKKIVSDVFGTLKRDSLRQYRTVYLEVPKKNGKTQLAAGFANYLLFADGEPGAEVYSAASTRDQASICFRAAAGMVRQCDVLDERCRIIDSTKVIYLKDDPNSFYKAISADADVQDGINPSGAIYDELHRLKHRDLWDVLEYGTATRDQPLIVVITTAGVVGKSPICEEMHDKAVQILKGTFKDPSFYAVIYGLEKDEDWTFEGEPAKFDRGGTKIVKSATGWYKANPALGDFMKIEAVRKEVNDAKQIPSKQNSLRRFRFNQWTNAESIWIPSDKWALCGEPFNPDDLLGKTCYGGLDLSTVIDITASVLAFPMPEDEVWLLPEFWLPEEGLQERCRRDMVPYDVWAKQGFLKLTPGDVVDYAFIRQRIKEQFDLYGLVEIGHDPWNATDIVTRLTEDDGLTLVPIRQGWSSLSAPSKEFEKRVIGKKLRHNGNPILKWMMDCCSIRSDPAGNIKPVKPDRAKTSKRIDGIAAAIMAIDRLTRNENGPSVYEERGLIVI
jgi:phage terminase large subunit-like protein